MKRHNITSKIFFILSAVFFICAVILLGAHTFYQDKYFNTIHNFHNPQSEFLENTKSDTSILLVSDTGSNNLILRQVLKDAMTSGEYDFVMYLGDFAKNASVTGFYWMLNDIKSLLNETPFYTIPGNHDITRRIGLTKQHFMDKSFYETVMGARYYWFGYGDTLFVTLDSSDETLDDKQLKWLDTTLKKIRPMFKNCIIFGHVPPANTGVDHIMTADSIQKFEKIVKKHKINAMFFGHIHMFSHGKFANTDFYTTPSSGQAIRDIQNHKYGYINVNINKNGLVKVEPKYIEFSGAKHTPWTEWFVRDITSVKVRMIIRTALLLSFAFLIIALLYRKHK